MCEHDWEIRLGGNLKCSKCGKLKREEDCLLEEEKRINREAIKKVHDFYNLIQSLREEIKELKKTIIYVDSYLENMDVPYANMCSEEIRKIMPNEEIEEITKHAFSDCTSKDPISKEEAIEKAFNELLSMDTDDLVELMLKNVNGEFAKIIEESGHLDETIQIILHKIDD
ncbi:MAG: hypothetical protein ACOC5T_09555 [Elusimicrobiota bacterium]